MMSKIESAIGWAVLRIIGTIAAVVAVVYVAQQLDSWTAEDTIVPSRKRAKEGDRPS